MLQLHEWVDPSTENVRPHHHTMRTIHHTSTASTPHHNCISHPPPAITHHHLHPIPIYGVCCKVVIQLLVWNGNIKRFCSIGVTFRFQITGAVLCDLKLYSQANGAVGSFASFGLALNFVNTIWITRVFTWGQMKKMYKSARRYTQR